MDQTDKAAKLKTLLKMSEKTVFFTGAGVSTESGIPDFRSSAGIYNQTLNERLHQKVITPEEVISATFFRNYPADFYDFYKEKLIYPEALPNQAHYFMAGLERIAEENRSGKVNDEYPSIQEVTVVTQNIDGLHQKAGSRHVCELHGSVLRNYCMRCGKKYTADAVLSVKTHDVPRCSCGGMIRPDVVLYEEALDDEVVSDAVHAIRNADTLIIGGTSLIVYPAAGLIRYFRGKNLILINKSETQADSSADLVIHEAIGQVFGKLLNEEE